MCFVLGYALRPFQALNLRFGVTILVSVQTGFSLNQVEIDGFDQFFRKKYYFLCALFGVRFLCHFWSRICDQIGLDCFVRIRRQNFQKLMFVRHSVFRSLYIWSLISSAELELWSVFFVLRFWSGFWATLRVESTNWGVGLGFGTDGLFFKSGRNRWVGTVLASKIVRFCVFCLGSGFGAIPVAQFSIRSKLIVLYGFGAKSCSR